MGGRFGRLARYVQLVWDCIVRRYSNPCRYLLLQLVAMNFRFVPRLPTLIFRNVILGGIF